MKQKLTSLMKDTLVLNSAFLMLATIVMAGFGFLFWLLAARMYSTVNVGLATTLISVMNMIALLSLVGFDVAFVRFLPNSTQKNDKMNTGLIVVGISSAILASIFVLFVDIFSPSLDFIRHTTSTSIAFVLFSMMTALNILTDSVFLAYRKAKYTLIINTIFSLVRLILPLLFVTWGALGIFTSVALSQSIGFFLSIGVMIWKFDYRPAFTVSKEVLFTLKNYALNNYLAGILNLLPATILPIFITNHLGPEQAAYFFMVMMIGNLLYAVPWATTRALFAEGSHDDSQMVAHTIKSLKIISILLLPAIIVLLLGGGIVLSFFGKAYSTEGVVFLRYVALTGIAVSAYSILGSFFRIQKSPKWLIPINASYAGTILGLSYILLPYGLTGVGVAWFIGHIIASFVGYVLLKITKDIS